jgi:hypothetical protein
MIREANVQEEFNFHNLGGVHGSVRMAGLIVLFAMCFVLPVSKLSIASARDWYQKLGLPVFPIWGVGIVVIAVAFMAFPRFVLGKSLFVMDETGEFLLGVGMMAFALTECLRRPATPTA